MLYISFLFLIKWISVWLHLSHRTTNPTKWPVHPAKTQISLDSDQESSLSAWNLESLGTNWAYSDDSDQTGRMLRLIRVFVGRTYHFVGLVMLWLIYNLVYHLVSGQLKRNISHLFSCFHVKHVKTSTVLLARGSEGVGEEPTVCDALKRLRQRRAMFYV